MRSILIYFCLLAPFLSAQSITIQQPGAGQSVQGTVTIAGITSGFASGAVAISIDGGTFQPAQGLQSWTFAWDTNTVADGQHLVRARARDFPSLPTFDAILVTVQNVATPQITIVTPEPNETVPAAFVVTGTATQATTVELAVDGGPFELAQGVSEWSVTFAAGQLGVGPHTLVVRASDGSQTVLATRSIAVGTPMAGTSQSAYLSSVDGTALTAQVHVPPGFDASVARPLLVFLHGAGGSGASMTNNAALLAELDARGWLGVAPDGRRWGLASQGCQWQFSPAYVDSPNPDVGPGEQDILDAIDFYAQAYGIDVDRIYLSGFSYGGRGSYIIGLKNPDRFAAIAPLGPPIDMYEVYERRPQNAICKEGIAGGIPGDSPLVDTMYTITSSRFLIENAYNLPVFHGHGLLDTVASNSLSNAPFLHGFHITTDTSWNACHGSTNLCFGHTPTLSELRARHANGYDWAYSFTPIGHMTDAFWFTGGVPPAGSLGTADPNDPSMIVGMFDFLEQHTLARAPETVVFKTYTDTHKDAYWLSLESATPWLDVPAAVRAHRDPANNELTLELARAAKIVIATERAELLLAPQAALTLHLQALSESTYDPALQLAPGEAYATTIELRGDFTASQWFEVLLDGVPLAAALSTFDTEHVTIGPLAIGDPATLTVTAFTAFTDLGFGLFGTLGEPELTGTGATTPGRLVQFTTANARPSSAGLMILGATTIFAPVVGGILVPSPDVIIPFGLDASGTATVSATWPALVAGTSLYLQAAVLDPAAPQLFAASNGLRATTAP
jgi:pimeloyl-ACP methyl ester carboxylesterase